MHGSLFVRQKRTGWKLCVCRFQQLLSDSLSPKFRSNSNIIYTFFIAEPL